MAVSLYDLSVASFQQTLGAVAGFLEKGRAYCAEKNIDPESVVATRLYPDMFPFRFQIHSVVHHSLGAIEGVQAGVFLPPMGLPDLNYAGLQARVAEARTALEKISRSEVEAMQGKDVVFRLGDNKIPFTAEGFLMSFSLPNFYFHAATAYDILRMQGVPLGKRDFMGKLRMKS